MVKPETGPEVVKPTEVKFVYFLIQFLIATCIQNETIKNSNTHLL